jgi:hypothetical protein
MASDTSLIFNLVTREQVSEGLGKAKEKFDAAGTAIAASLGGALSYGIAESMDVGAANAKLQAQLGLTDEQAKGIGKTASKLFSQGWGEDIGGVDDAIRGAFTNIPGMTDQMVQGIAGKALGISEIFDVEAAGVEAGVGQMLKTGLVKDANEGMDLVTKAFQTFGGDGQAILDVLGEYSVQFQKVGIDGSTAMGLVNQMMSAGAKDTDLAADAIKEFAIRAVDGSATTIDAYKSLGFNAEQMQQKIAAGGPGAAAASQQIVEALKGIKDPAERSRIAVELFGTQSEDLGAALYGIDFTTASSEMGDFAGATDKAMEAIGSSPAAQLETAKRQIQTKLTEIGGVIVGWAMGHTDVVKPLAIGLAAIAAVILAVKAAMTAWTVATNIWRGVQAAATAAQWLWNAAMSANPIGLIIIGIVALVAAFVLLWQHSEKFREIVTAAFNGVKDAAMWMWDGIQMVWSKITGFFTGLPAMFAGWFSAAGQWLYDAGSKIIEGLWTGIQFYFKIVEFFYIQLPLKILGYFASAALWLLDAGKSILSGLWSGIKWVWDTLIVGFYLQMPLTIRGWLASAGTWLLQKGRDILAGLWSGIKETWSANVSFFTGLGGTVIHAIGNGATWLYQLGRDVIIGMANGVVSMAQWLKDKVVGVVKAPIVAAKSVLGMHSPSRVWAEQVGVPIPQGVAVGIRSGLGYVDSAVGALTDAVMPVPLAPAPLAVRAVGGDGTAAAPVNLTINVSTPLLERGAAERLGQVLLPVVQRGLRTYGQSNGGVINITV